MQRSKLVRLLGIAVPVTVIALAGWANLSLAQEKKPEEKKMGKDIVETLKEAGNYNTFTKLLQTAELTATWKGEGPFTVFAPTDQAFDKLAKGTVEDWMKPENKSKLRDILNYHATKGKHLAADIQKMKTVKTINGQEATISQKGGNWMIDNAKITKTDLACSNGYVHQIDTCLMPKERH